MSVNQPNNTFLLRECDHYVRVRVYVDAYTYDTSARGRLI